VFIGHFAVAFASKKVAPKVSLGTLVVAAAFLDVVWPVLVLLGVERFRIVPGFTAINPFDFVHYPWSHSLLMTAVWALLFALVYLAVRGDRAGAVWLGIAVASHWVLDFVSHRPDLPLYPGGGERLGLGLWQSLPATFAVEGLMFAAGIALYMQSTKAKDRAERSHGGHSSPCSSAFIFRGLGLRRRRAKTRWRSWESSPWRSSPPGRTGSTGIACPRADRAARAVRTWRLR